MNAISDAAWREARPPYISTHALTDAESAEALEASVHIARVTRNAQRQVDRFYCQPVTFAELAALATDAPAAWAAWLTPLRAATAAVATARALHTRLIALLGEAGTVLDHGWDVGSEQISVAAIGEHVTAAEAVVAPLVALEKSLKATVRRAT